MTLLIVCQSLEELHVLLSLCKAAPYIDSTEAAETLLTRLSPYLLESHEQIIAQSHFLRSIEPSPWNTLTYNLVVACLAIGLNHPFLHNNVYSVTIGYLHRSGSVARDATFTQVQYNDDVQDPDMKQTTEIAALTLSVLGFLEAASVQFYFYTVLERLEVLNAVRRILTEAFLVSVEGAFSSIRTSDSSTREVGDWKIYTKRYASSGRPLGAMLLQKNFMRLVLSCSALQIASVKTLQSTGILDYLMLAYPSGIIPPSDENTALVELLTDVAIEQMRLLEDGADYLQLGSAWQQHLASSVKGYSLITFLCCMIVDEEVADMDVLMSWLEDSMADTVQMADDTLACDVLKCLAISARSSQATAASLSRSLPRFIVQSGIQGQTVAVAARCLASILQQLSPDAVITGLYSLGNVLSASLSAEKGVTSTFSSDVFPASRKSARYIQQNESAISLDVSGDAETSTVFGTVIRAIVGISIACKDPKIAALALSMLIQKLGRISMAVDLHIIVETATLAAVAEEMDLKSLLRLYNRFAHDATVSNNSVLLDAILKARLQLAEILQPDSALFIPYMTHLLETIISKGDVHESENTHQADIDLTAQEIVQMLPPLAILTSAYVQNRGSVIDDVIVGLQREAWFNVIVHDITPGSILGHEYINHLRILAINSEPLIAETRTDHLGIDIELNTVLRRGMSGPHTMTMKKRLIQLLATQESHIKVLSYPRIIFLHTIYYVETLRAEAGSCSNILPYFMDPSINQGEMGVCIAAIADRVMTIYLRQTLAGLHSDSSASHVSNQLATIFKHCCHRILKCQQAALMCADRLISHMPSSLCQKASLFSLLEILTLMWSSCLETEIDEYEWKSTYTSPLVDITLELSDDFAFRRRTLDTFYSRAKTWVMQVINIAPLDVKGLLQTYLAAYEDDGAYGHVALGRSFAIELGSAIPSTDARLGAIDFHGACNINTASDFITQYTTRQEYKYADALSGYDRERVKFLTTDRTHNGVSLTTDQDAEDAQTVLAILERRVLEQKSISISEVRDILRRAAALLCRSKQDQCAILHHLVEVPFAIFTKQSIKLGISLWLSVINENPRMGSRILTEIAVHWEHSVLLKHGVLSEQSVNLDPFYIKEEFAPSDKNALLKRQQTANSLVAPHLRILQFLTSHFSANRLSSLHLRRIFQRLTRITLKALLRKLAWHPLAREFYFQVILFGLTILRYSDDLGEASKWKLQNKVVVAALSWFSSAPKWSFGGNRLQIKAEVRLMMDVEAALAAVASTNLGKTNMTLHSLALKQELLEKLLENEIMRLQVWLFPLDHAHRHLLLRHRSEKPPVTPISILSLSTAWAENPGLAIQLVMRFPSPLLLQEIRRLLINSPEKALEEADALPILLGDRLPGDLTTQFKYLLYWAPVNPMMAVTYFLPAYNNHPFILQYAMRALESHPVDVTFFYVPQIVQALRYDALGYVQRYIVETAKFSQLFAHQIIWNMKANAFKDEDSTIEDPIKPTLDRVMNHMIESFSDTDKAFFEREFAFFNEITDISGKLRPFIKKSKAEKKQKIEEELRKIKVEVGVYLPSNPDGVVIGIDRKSGKPLQSHAKAPYMATFRIKKTVNEEMESTDQMLEKTNQNQQGDRSGPTTHEPTNEVWQSAIFKVGDDCRQDVLALQMIAAFRGIFNNVGLDVYVYPYRVTATAPGCGVIDVLPNSISRDMLGREAVNGLYDYFISKYGGEESIRFQEARNNFVKSMAGYSIISYLLQFKDRHNGNIMVDDAGHILHIDFGFCFDIAPGGVRFERAPFKLTSEMVAVMGGSTTSQSYKWFEELCVKAFLASRPYAEKLSHLVVLMLDSGLPCFKPYTIQHFQERFVLGKTEREAAEFVRLLIRKSYGSYSTGVYDQFQLLTNGIPY